MEIEGGRLAATLANERGKKRPPSPPPLSGDDDDDSSISEDDDGDWLASDSEEEDDLENKVSASNIDDCSDECLCWGMNLLQFIDVKIAGYRHSHPSCAKIFGFVAAQGTIEPSRNDVYKREIGNCEPVSVEQETGVARLSLTSSTIVISMSNQALIEFKLHVLSEDEKGDDLIIEGCTEIHKMELKSFIEQRRLYGENCALDVKFAVLISAAVARVNIEVLRVPSHGIDLKLYAKTSGLSDIIRLFQGAVLEVGFTGSFVVAVEIDSSLDLCIKGSPRDDDHAHGQKLLWCSWRHSFISDYHGTVEEPAKLGDFAEIAVKVTWRSYEKRFMH